MALTQVTGPYPIFTDLDGTPLDDGYLYIGDVNQDPEQNPIQVYWDSALTIPASQPIRTNNGYAYRNGTPALIYTAGQFSITIRNKREEFVIYSPVGYGFDPGAVSASVVKNDFVGNGVQVNFTLSAAPSTILATNVFINGVYQEKDSYSILGNVLTFTVAPPLSSSIEVMTNETGVINSGNATAISYTAGFPGATAQTVQTKLEQYVSVKDFGAIGDGVTDDTAEIQAALTAAGINRFALYFPGTDSHYLITDALTVPDGVMVYGDGWTSFIRQTTLNKGAFIAGDCNVFRDIRVKVADGDDSAFVNCIFASGVNNLTVENCFLELSDLGGTGVHIRGVKNSLIRGNRIYGGKYTSGVAAAASAADILLYSSTASERHIIDNNHCLSNNSQGIYAGALGYDGDIIISNNICVTLDPATCTETGTWSLVASGGDRRHGILVTYSNAQAGIPRTVVTGNICRNTQWTGIYKNDLSQGEIIISNNLCDLNGYDNSTPLSGGIYVEAAGKVIVTGNTVSNYQSTVTGTGAYTINQATAENLPALFSSNKAVGSLGYGLAIGTGARLLYVTDNLFTGNTNTDIYVSTNPVATAGGITILNNRIIRSSGNTISALRVDPQSSTRVTIIKGNYITGFDNTNNSNSNAGIFVRSASKLVQVEDNTIENFYRAFFSDEYYSSGRMADRVIQNNVIRDCAIGFDVSAGNNNLNTLPLVGNVFIDTPVQVANTTGFAVGRLVQRLGNNFVWQTTASPTVGSWLIGDRSVNSTPAVGQPKAWACTVTGAPGTWVSEGNL